MARDPVQVVQTVRRRAVEQARYALGACLRTEADVADRIKAIDRAAELDRTAHKAVEDGYQFQDMFSLRTQASQAERRIAAADLAAAQASSAEARGAVVAARTAAEAVQTLIDERLVAAEAETSRRVQHALDDITRTRRDPGYRLETERTGRSVRST